MEKNQRAPSFSLPEILQFTGFIPFAAGAYLIVYRIIGFVLAVLKPAFGKEWSRRFSESSGSGLFGYPWVLPILLMIVGIVVMYIAGLWARQNELNLRLRLEGLRDALQRFETETGQYPSSLQDLVALGYLPRIPRDPIRWPSRAWHEVWSEKDGGIMDVRSRSHGQSTNGSTYDSW